MLKTPLKCIPRDVDPIKLEEIPLNIQKIQGKRKLTSTDSGDVIPNEEETRNLEIRRRTNMMQVGIIPGDSKTKDKPGSKENVIYKTN